MTTVLGPLPVKYRLWIAVTGIVTFTLAGAWLGYVTEVTASWPIMTVVGAVLGLVAVGAVLRASGDHGHGKSAPHH